MRELSHAEYSLVSGGLIDGGFHQIGDVRFPVLQGGDTGGFFNLFSEHEGVTGNMMNSQGGVTIVHFAGASLASDGAFIAADGQYWNSPESWLNQQAHLEQCQNWAAVMAIGGAVAIVGAAGTLLGGSGTPIMILGTVIGGAGAVGYWMSGCG